MSKKNKRKNEASIMHVAPTIPAISISKRGWKVVGAGILVVISGFVLLCFTDPRGQNLASSLSPILIIGGYVAIAFGIIIKNPAS